MRSSSAPIHNICAFTSQHTPLLKLHWTSGSSNKPSLCILQEPRHCHLLCEASLTVTSRQSQPLSSRLAQDSCKTPTLALTSIFTRLFLPCLTDCAPGRLELSYSLFDSQSQARTWHQDILNICLLAKPRENLQWQTKKCHPWLCLIVNQQVGWRQSRQQANQTCKWQKNSSE